jgi:Flp pilus assembly protein TadD
MNTKEKVLLHRGMDKVRQGLYDEAIDVFDKVLSMNKESTYAWNNRGVALFKAGRPEDALLSYNQSLMIDPENLDALRNTGFVLMSMGRMQEALETYEHVISAGGDHRDLESLATVLVGMGMLHEALDCLKQAMSIQPTERIEQGIIALMEMIDQQSSNV